MGGESVMLWCQSTTYSVFPCAQGFPYRCCNRVVLCPSFLQCFMSSVALLPLFAPLAQLGPENLQPVLSSWGLWSTTASREDDRKSRLILQNHLLASAPLHRGTPGFIWTACGKALCTHESKIIHSKEIAIRILLTKTLLQFSLDF